MQVYRPLYEDSYAHRNGGLFDLRPLQMFYEPATKDDQPVARFTKITDPGVIAELREIKARMYPDPCSYRVLCRRDLVMHCAMERIPAVPMGRNETSRATCSR